MALAENQEETGIPGPRIAPARPPVPLYAALARAVGAYHRCVVSKNDWQHEHARRIAAMVERHIPSGSGLDAGPRLDLDESTEERLEFERCDYHHMNSGGYYDGWTHHRVIALPSLAFGVHVKVTGRDRLDVKGYIAEQFHIALKEMVDEFEGART